MWLWVVGIVVLTGVIAVIAVGSGDAVGETYDDRPDTTVPVGRPLTADDLGDVRFNTAVRGYRMDEVDALLARVRADLLARESEDQGGGSGVRWEGSEAGAQADPIYAEQDPADGEQDPIYADKEPVDGEPEADDHERDRVDDEVDLGAGATPATQRDEADPDQRASTESNPEVQPLLETGPDGDGRTGSTRAP